MIHLQALTNDDLQSCDWGFCDREAVAVRLDVDNPSPFDVWLSVCEVHSREESASEAARVLGADRTIGSGGER